MPQVQAWFLMDTGNKRSEEPKRFLNIGRDYYEQKCGECGFASWRLVHRDVE